MSGTSADGIDAALVAFDEDGAPALLDSRTLPHSPQIKAEIESVVAQGNLNLADCMRLDQQLGDAFAKAALGIIGSRKASEIAAIGCHGQTVLHNPQQGYTVQLGNGAVIAERTGITTVTDFRAADMAAGGQGAPLAPAFHANVFAHSDLHRAVVNIGGIANITLLPAGDRGNVIGFDTGPGNTLLDLWCAQHTKQAYDVGGTLALSGEINQDLLERCLNDPYFDLPPPKSTGREYFNQTWLDRISARCDALAVQDMLATLAALTADSISDAIKQCLPDVDQVFVCGGGAHNRAILQRLAANLGCSVTSTSQLGVSPDDVESMAFAWLAWTTLEARAGNLPSVTGASKPKLLGCIWPVLQ